MHRGPCVPGQHHHVVQAGLCARAERVGQNAASVRNRLCKPGAQLVQIHVAPNRKHNTVQNAMRAFHTRVARKRGRVDRRQASRDIDRNIQRHMPVQVRVGDILGQLGNIDGQSRIEQRCIVANDALFEFKQKQKIAVLHHLEHPIHALGHQLKHADTRRENCAKIVVSNPGLCCEHISKLLIEQLALRMHICLDMPQQTVVVLVERKRMRIGRQREQRLLGLRGAAIAVVVLGAIHGRPPPVRGEQCSNTHLLLLLALRQTERGHGARGQCSRARRPVGGTGSNGSTVSARARCSGFVGIEIVVV
eukprot:comp19273_c0_seq1/m.36186 comp19273_c0_seq1/g.36186  ORF comp19273_c0_seq1/g.36186 comp19273_c0_seq1/m.36186 type:complete len:306 (-) comp19273_c0_seq1:687-1604(-)